MKIRLGDFDYTECWDGILYKKLSAYPDITDWEIQNIIDFIRYEKMNGRDCVLEGNERALTKIQEMLERGKIKRVPVPKKIEECTACPTYKGCMTDLVCHTSPIENAVKILECGSLLSAVKARNLSAEELQKEARNAANDPADYFNYVMFTWGNCQAGDRLVMERKLGRFPNDEDLSIGFTPGVRFYFRYETLLTHPNVVIDGVLPVKVKDEVVLKDYVHAILVPACEKARFEGAVPDDLTNRVYYLENDCKDIWEWSEKVYEFARHF